MRNLTDLRFADDVVLVAQQRTDIVKMLRQLATTSAKFGLRINFLKTKVLTWGALSGNHERVDVHGQHVDILREEESER